MEKLPPLSGAALRYEALMANEYTEYPGDFAEFENDIVSLHDFRNVFRKHSRIMSKFWQEKGHRPPLSAFAVAGKYTDAYLEYIYDQECENRNEAVMTWGALEAFLDDWDARHYALMGIQLVTATSPGDNSPSE